MGLISSMKALGTSLNTMEDLFLFQLKDLLGAEDQIIEALPTMVKGAHDAELKKALEEHLRQTQLQRERLVKAFDELGQKATAESCDGMKGLIQEGEILLKANGDAAVKDAALIAAAQRVE